MGFDVAVQTFPFLGNEDRRWLGTRLGTNQNRSITLDPSLFTANHLINGALPSGTVLGLTTATGFYGPYDDAATGTGRETAAGFLFNTTRLGNGTGLDLATAAKVGAPLYWGPGIIKQSFLPAPAATTGKIDAAARTDLIHFIRFET